MAVIQHIFLENKAWVLEKLQTSPGFFSESAKDQRPNFVWVGCSDSRILPNEITGTSVGDLFVHRNIANMVIHDDMNLMSVIYYAVQYLKAKHVIVCGHYGCGGVRASMTDQSFGLLDGWLKHIKTTVKKHQAELDGIKDDEQKFERLVDLNVVEQVMSLKSAPHLKQLFIDNPDVSLHGWVYDMRTGYLKNMIREKVI